LAAYRLALNHFVENAMRATLEVSALIAAFFLATWPCPSSVQTVPPPEQQQPAFTSDELVGTGRQFFGTVSRGLASLAERAVGKWGLPNGYVLGEEAGALFSAASDTGRARSIPRMPAISRCSGRGRRSDGISAVTARGL
jgi:hypothetical protein